MRVTGITFSWLLGGAFALATALICVKWLTADGTFLSWAVPWSPEMGIEAAFVIDGLAVLFLLLIGLLGAAVLPYSGAYLHGHRDLGRFYVLMAIFAASMAGLVMADNTLLLVVFWELTSVSSFFLIGFHDERSAARAAATQALLVTGIGGLALLGSFVLLAHVTGTFQITPLMESAGAIRDSGLYTPIVLLFAVGAFTKSAQMPFHFWLPNAMEAPTPVSAYLHSATMVNAGIYLLARFSPILGGTGMWAAILCSTGAITAVVAAVNAFGESDMKRVLAYSTVSALGLMTVMIGIGTAAAAAAAVLYLTAHALYKGTLFLVAGILDHQTGIRDVTRLSGLKRAMPLTTAIAVAAGISMAGLPGGLGFIAKEAVYEASWEAAWPTPFIAISFVASSLVLALAGVCAFRPFFGSTLPTPKPAEDPVPAMWLGPAILASSGIVLGLWPSTLYEGMLGYSASAITSSGVPSALPHGSAAVVALSVGTIVAGVILYILRKSLGLTVAAIGFNAQRGYAAVVDSVNVLAQRQTKILQNGYLRVYLLTILGTMILFTGFVLANNSAVRFPWDFGDVRFHEGTLAVVIAAAALVAVRSTSRFGAITALGISGYGVALLFVLFGAPDLAITQFLVETLLVILLVFVFRKLPRFAQFATRGLRIRDGAFAAAVGLLMAVLVSSAANSPSTESVSAYFAENSLSQGHGRNVVNVILVDFRGLDTLGEITVLAVAGLGVYALLKLKLGERGAQ